MKLGFACPYTINIPASSISQIGATQYAAWRNHWVGVFATIRTAPVPACEQIVKKALEHKQLEALFWTEDDCVLPHVSVQRLVDLLEKHPEADMASGITFMRHPPHHPMISYYDPAVRGFDMITSINTKGEPFWVDHTSFNCLLIRRSGLEKIAAIEKPFNSDVMTTVDCAMFENLYLNGGVKLIIDPGLLCGHLSEPELVDVNRWIGHMQKMVESGEAKVGPSFAEVKHGMAG